MSSTLFTLLHPHSVLDPATASAASNVAKPNSQQKRAFQPAQNKQIRTEAATQTHVKYLFQFVYTHETCLSICLIIVCWAYLHSNSTNYNHRFSA